MKKLLMNKKVIETIITIITVFMLLGVILTAVIFIHAFSQSEATVESNIHCYWTTKGIICGGKLGE